MKNILKKRLTRIKERIRLYLTKGGKEMKTTREKREELEYLLFKKNVDSVIEEMYESDEIFERVDDLSLKEVYEIKIKNIF